MGGICAFFFPHIHQHSNKGTGESDSGPTLTKIDIDDDESGNRGEKKRALCVQKAKYTRHLFVVQQRIDHANQEIRRKQGRITVMEKQELYHNLEFKRGIETILGSLSRGMRMIEMKEVFKEATPGKIQKWIEDEDNNDLEENLHALDQLGAETQSNAVAHMAISRQGAQNFEVIREETDAWFKEYLENLQQDSSSILLPRTAENKKKQEDTEMEDQQLDLRSQQERTGSRVKEHTRKRLEEPTDVVLAG